MKLDKSLIVFLTACDPTPEKCLEIMHASNADILEIGIPFSDPVADGATIQKSYQKVLERGFKLSQVFDLIKAFRRESETPIVIMSYFNPIYRMGVEIFAERAYESGANGVLVVDLPVDEAMDLIDVSRDYGLSTIFLAAPNTSEDRLRAIDEVSDFIYLVSTYGVTGARDKVSELAFKALKKLKSVCKKPVAVGFGVSKREHVEQLFEAGADGVVVGSAVIKIIEKYGENAAEKVREFTKSLKV